MNVLHILAILLFYKDCYMREVASEY